MPMASGWFLGFANGLSLRRQPVGRGLVSYATNSRDVYPSRFVVIIPSTMGLLADAATTYCAAPSTQHRRDIDSTARGTEHPPDRVARTRHPNPRPACAAVRVATVALPVRVIRLAHGSFSPARSNLDRVIGSIGWLQT